MSQTHNRRNLTLETLATRMYVSRVSWIITDLTVWAVFLKFRLYSNAKSKLKQIFNNRKLNSICVGFAS
jgi:hypothetical protein